MRQKIAALPPVSETLNNYKITANKKLGQHFLFDLNLTDKIVRYSGEIKNKNIIEIGPGPGALTRSILLAEPKKLTAFEMDERFIEMLDKELSPLALEHLEIVKQDALKYDYSLIEGKVKIIANLPYNISTQLLFLWLEHLDKFESLTLMFQKDVADRINAKPRSKAYGKISVLTQRLCYVEHICDILPQSFYPPPKVVSTVLNIVPRKEPLAEADPEKLDLLLRASFGQRRKTLRASLKNLNNNISGILNELQLNPNARPEELSVEELCLLTRHLL